MISNARQIPVHTTLHADVCIVGGGAAGISIAKQLAGSKLQVILLAGGGKKETVEARDLYRGAAWPEKSHEPLEENRRRQWGGTTAAWGGRCVPLDPIDLEKRDWIPHSGWPISWAQLSPFYARANALCEAGAPTYRADEAFPHAPREIIQGFDGREVVSWPLERWGPPTHFGKRYGPELAAARNVTVLLHANCLHIQLESNGSSVTHIDASSPHGTRFRIAARQFILACGGLENARLLLASDDIHSTGIGNQTDQVGRYYMSHLVGSFARARLRDVNGSLVYDFERDADGVYCRRRFWVTPEAQADEQIGNAIAFFFRPQLGPSPHRDGLFSATYLTKFMLGTLRRRSLRQAISRIRKNRAALAEHLKIVLADAPGLAPQTCRVVRDRWFAERRLPYVLPPKSDNNFHLFYQAEHAPNPSSRVVLDTQRDALGMPRLQAQIAFSEIDLQTVLAAHRLIKRRFEASGTGDLLFDETALREKLAIDIRHFNSSAHHMGTTRMGTDPHTSVVDADCQVHGVHNLYLAGASVFPTSGHANPTLTLVALAVRLAEHLKAMPGSEIILDTRVSRQLNRPPAETLAHTALSR